MTGASAPTVSAEAGSPPSARGSWPALNPGWRELSKQHTACSFPWPFWGWIWGPVPVNGVEEMLEGLLLERKMALPSGVLPHFSSALHLKMQAPADFLLSENSRALFL